MSKWVRPAALSVSAGVMVFCCYKTLKWLYKRKFQRESYLKEKGVDVHLINTVQEWNEVYDKLMDGIKQHKVLGLDCEWVLKGKVALLQLCTPNGVCALLRLSKMVEPLPDTLVSLLADRSVIKTGVAVTNDGKKLHVDYGLMVVGCVDLRHLLMRVRSVRENYNNRSKGLKGLASEILHVDISKDPHIRCGNWEADCYSQSQIDYAASDAVVGVEIFIQLVLAKMSETETSGELPEDFWTVARSMCQGVVDVSYEPFSSGGGEGSNSRPNRKLKDENKIYSTRKRPLWDNCVLQAPDGNMLCTCDRRKAQWYLTKELADQVCDDPITVRLRFEPSSRPESERNYYLQEKENRCVCCGSDKDYVRKFVIPFEYKKFFPSALKDHCSHDVLLLCTSCHRQSSDCDALLRQRLANECDAPIDSGVISRTVVDHDLQRIRSAGRALKTNRHSIPPGRLEELERILFDFFGVDTLSDDVIETASELNARQASEDYIPHGKRVVRHMVMNGGLLAFQARWRQHFLDTMNPQFLPTYWSVDFVPEQWTKMMGNV